MDVEIIDRSGLEEAQKRLMPKLDSGLRGGDEQREFIGLVVDAPQDFCERVRSWGLRIGKTPPVTERPLTEKEFVDPPWSTERVVASTWGELPAGLAARPETWTRIHLEMIEQQRMKSWYLAADGKGESGRARIAQALKGSDAQKIDACVRAVFRRLGGVISDRANRTAFIDCPLAKAWWRFRYAKETHLTFGRGSVEELSKALRASSRWEPFVEAMISNLTVVGDAGIRPALVQSLADGVGTTREEVKDVLGWIGRRSTVQLLGAVGPERVLGLVSEEFLGTQGGRN